MFPTSIAAFVVLLIVFKKVRFVFSIILQSLYLTYLVYAIIAPVGVLWANIALTCISVAYMVYFFVTKNRDTTEDKLQKRKVKHTVKRMKLVINAATLGIAIYGLCNAVENATFFSVLLVVLMLMFWFAQMIMEIFIHFAQRRLDKMKAKMERNKLQKEKIKNLKREKVEARRLQKMANGQAVPAPAEEEAFDEADTSDESEAVTE